jgi:hypothetical protein
MEDDSGSTRAANAIPKRSSAYINNITFGSDTAFPASKGVATINDSTSSIKGLVGSTGSTGTAFFMLYFKYPTNPSSNTVLAEIYGNGSITKWEIVVTSTGYLVNGYDVDGTNVTTNSTAWGATASPNQWMAMRLLMKQNGANFTIEHAWYALGKNFYGQTYNVTGQTFKRFTGFRVFGNNGNDGLKVAHVAISESEVPIVTNQFIQASIAYVGESAAARVARICREEGVTTRIIGDPTDTELMGPQPIATLMDILYECADVDGGRLFEPKDRVLIAYRSRVDLYNKLGFNLDYKANHLSEIPEPVEDDQNIVNDVRINRAGGSYTRAVKEDGPLSVLAPPNGVGRYDTSYTLNTYSDDRLDNLAQWAVFKGTWDEARYPHISVNLARKALLNNASVTASLKMADIGDKFSLINLPSFVPPGPIDLLIEGCTVYLNAFEWSITFNCSPYGPYQLNNLQAGTELLADADDSTVNTAFNTTATSMSVATATAPVWTSANVPFDILVAGERMTVTAISGTSSPQTFTVTRSVNGIVKAHSVGESILLANPMYASL